VYLYSLFNNKKVAAETCLSQKKLASFLVGENSGESGRWTKSACAIVSKTAPMNPCRRIRGAPEKESRVKRLDPQIQKPRRSTCPGAALLLRYGAA
jgi:hypothetical protein